MAKRQQDRPSIKKGDKAEEKLHANKTPIQRALPYALPIVAFLILSAVFFRYEVFQGMTLRQGDIISHRSASAEIREYEENFGRRILWTGRMFAGMPTYYLSIVPPGGVVKALTSIFKSGVLSGVASIVFAQMLGFFILALAFGVRPIYAVLGSIAFGFCSNSLISLMAGHNTKILALAAAPLVLAGIVTVYRGRYLLGFILSVVGTGIQIFSNHLQITYYLLFIILFLVINEIVFAYREKRIQTFVKASSILLAAGAIGVAMNAASLLVTLEFLPQSQRGGSELPAVEEGASKKSGGLSKEYVFQWSNGIMESMTHIVPRFYGGSSSEPVPKGTEVAQRFGVEEFPYYWGDQPFTEGPQYIGVTVFVFFVLAMFILPDRIRWWMLASVVLGLMISWGRNLEWFNYFMYDYFPGFNRFRTVTIAFSIVQIIMPLGAILGMQRLLAEPLEEKKMKQLLIATGVIGALLLLFAVSPGTAGNLEGPTDQRLYQQQTAQLQDEARKQQTISMLRDILEEDRKTLLSKDAWRSLLFLGIITGILFLYYKGNLKANIIGYALVLLVLVDLWSVAGRYLTKEAYVKQKLTDIQVPNPVDLQLAADPELNERVLDLRASPFNSSSASKFHHNVGGYSPLKVGRYQDVYERNLSDELQRLYQSFQNPNFNPQQAFSNTPVLNMLNTKYIIYGQEQNAYVQNPLAKGFAWFVEDIVKVNSPLEEIALLDSIDLSSAAAVDVTYFSGLEDTYPGSNTAEVEFKSYDPEHLTYNIKSTEGKSFLVLSEVYYNQWYALLNGEEIPLYRVNYLLRGVEIPQGEHTLELKFKSESYQTGTLIANIASGILLLLTFFAGFTFYQRSKKQTNILQEEKEPVLDLHKI